MLDGLDHDDGVVDDDADGQHQAEQREVVQAEARRRHHREGADDGHGHGHQGDDGRAPILQEQQHDEGHQQHGVAQRLEDLADRFVDERRGVVDDGVVQSLGKAFFQLLHFGADEVGRGQGVEAGQLVDRQRHRRFAIQGAGLVITLGAELDAGDVPHADDAAVAIGLQRHVAELIGVGQPAQGGHGVLEDLAPRHGRLSDLPRRHLDVLLLDGRHDVAGREIARGHLFRVQPQPHAVVALAQVGDIAHAGQAGQLVAKLDRGVVAQIEVVAAAVGREQVDDHQHVGRFLLHQHALAGDQVGQHRLRQRHAVLHQHLGHVQVDAQPERDRERVIAVVGALRRHVEHAFHAVDLLLDGGRHRVGHQLGVGAGIGGRHLHRGRRNFRVLGDRKHQDGDQAGQGNDDRQHRSEDRSIDEKA